jgi:hypothetical protein
VPECSQDAGSEVFLTGLSHTIRARTNAASCFGDLFVSTALNALLEVDQTWTDESRMGVGIHEAWDYYVPAAVKSFKIGSTLLLRLSLDLILGTHRDDLPCIAEDCCILDNSNLGQLAPASWALCAGGKLQGEQLADVGEQQRFDSAPS